MQPLVDFLNHGFLPFTGRSREVDRLVGFWRSTIDAHALRAALLLGEAGVGKSRLIEELMPRVADSGGAIAHLKFYPESSSPVAALVAEALWRSVAIRGVLRREPAPTLGSAAEALRRIARLRATMIVVEDIHLLAGDTLREFATLLSAIADEPLSILFVARPVELAARGVIEPFLVEEIELKGLGHGDLAGIWRRLFNAEIDSDVEGLLLEATRGNALALRSVLRGAVSAGAVTQDEESGRWSVSAPALAPLLERNLELLVAGMAAHLTPAERSAAATLAALGEIFARETATAILDDAEPMIGALLFKGILVTTSTPSTPLPGAQSERPLLSFTHTLLHRHFVAHLAADRPRLVAAIGAGLPLYSVLPFDVIARGGLDLRGLATDVVRSAFGRALRVNKDLDNSASWELGEQCWGAAAALLIADAGRWSREEWFANLTELLYQRLVSLRRSPPAAWEPLVNLYLELTADLSTHARREERCYALRFLHRLRWERDNHYSPELMEEVERLAREYPELRHGHGYIYFLGYHLTVAVERDDVLEQRRIEGLVEALIAEEGTPEGVRRGGRGMVGRSLINLVETPEELAARLRQLDELLAMAAGDDPILEHLQLCLHFQVGEMKQVIAEGRVLIPKLKEQGLGRSYWDSAVQSICAERALGRPAPELAAWLAQTFERGQDPFAQTRRRHLMHHMINAAILEGDRAAARAFARDHLQTDQLSYPQRIVLALDAGDDAMLADPPFELHVPYPELPALADHLLGRDEPPAGEAAGAGLAGAARRLLELPVIRLHSVLLLHAVIDLVEAIDRRHGSDLGELLKDAIAGSIERAMIWLAERGLAGWIAGLLDRYASRMAGGADRRWRECIERLRDDERPRDERAPAGTRMRLSMLGTIAVKGADGEVHPVRGARLKAMLGLMVANQMQRKPLAREEFWVLAGGAADDPVRSRKTMHQGVLRLRELMGRDAILTDEDVPHLNMEIVAVDLIDARALLDEAIEASRAGAFVRARTALAAALDMVGGEIPFPALYEEFFEAAREEFENLLRNAVLEIGGRLLREGDPASAEEILARGLASIPEDEEMGGLLRTALEHQGKHVEAARIRMRMERSQ